jgi:serine protease Do
VGIIAGRRPGYGLDDQEGLLQLSAPVNPGDSGAAIINSRGEVIGILFAATTPVQGADRADLVGNVGEGSSWGAGGSVGFVVPNAVGRAIVDEIRRNGRVVRGFLGMQIRGFSPDERRDLGLGGTPALLVTCVYPGGPADRAGFRKGDVLLALNGAPIGQPRALQRFVAQCRPAQEVRLAVSRGSSREELVAVLDELPAQVVGQTTCPESAPSMEEPAAKASRNRNALARRVDRLTRELEELRAHLDAIDRRSP